MVGAADGVSIGRCRRVCDAAAVRKWLTLFHFLDAFRRRSQHEGRAAICQRKMIALRRLR